MTAIEISDFLPKKVGEYLVFDELDTPTFKYKDMEFVIWAERGEITIERTK